MSASPFGVAYVVDRSRGGSPASVTLTSKCPDWM